MDALRLTGDELLDERLGQPGQRVVDRIAHMAMVNVAAVDRSRQLDDLSGMERSIDLGDGVGTRRPVLHGGIRDLAEGGAHGVDSLDLLRRPFRIRPGSTPGSNRSLEVDQAAIGEPAKGHADRRQLLDEETIVEVEGVQEVEGGLHIDVMRVAPDGDMLTGRSHRVTTLSLLTGYAQGATLCVTGKEFDIGYTLRPKGGPEMEALVLFIGLFVTFIVLGMAAVAFGVDSREPMLDDYRR